MATAPSSPDQANATGRQQLARMVVIGSFLTIALLVAMLLAIAQLGTSQRAADLAEKAFNAVLPVLASWVGTVLAFFFSSQSLERTSNSLDKAITAASGAGDGKTAAEVMIPLGQIRQLIDLQKEPATTLTLAALQARFKGLPAPLAPAATPTASATPAAPAAVAPPAKTGGTDAAVTRLVFVDSNVFRYVMHSSALNEYLVSHPGSETAPFDQMRQDPDTLQKISRLVVFVSASTSLSEARAALDRVAGAQDIIVTATGNSSEPMLGWITNIDLVKLLSGP
jgi:hypothetical protein